MFNAQSITSMLFDIKAKIALPLIVFVGAVAIAMVRTAQIPKQYSASARIWVQTRGADMNGNASGAQYLSSPLTTGMNALATACEVIKSDAVLTAAREQVAKEVPAKFCPSVGEMNGNLKIELVKDADIIKLNYSCGNDKIALSSLQALIDAFFHENTVAMVGNATKSKYYLSKQLEEAKALSQKTHANLRQFQEQTQTINLEAQAGSLLAEKEELEKEIIKTNQQALSEKQKLQFLEKQLGFKGNDVMSVDALAKDGILKGLRATIAEYEVKLVDLRAKYQEEHPKMKRLRAALDEAKQAMANRSKELIGSNSNSLSPDLGDSEVRGKMLDDMVQIQANEVASTQRLASLQSVLSTIKGQLAQIPKQQVGLSELVRADAVATDSLAGVEKELQNVILTESMAMGVSNLKVIDQPSVHESTPNVAGNGFITAFGLAFVIILLQYLLDPKVMRLGQITGRLSLPIEGWFPKLKPGMPMSQTLVSLQKLRLTVENWSNQGEKVVLVTSGSARDGKSTLAYGLALTLSENGSKVLLIDGNLAHPTLHIFCREQASPGLADFIENPTAAQAQECVRHVNDRLMLVPAGAIDPDNNPINTPAFLKLLKYFDPQVDVFLIDAPAAGGNLNALVLPKTETHVIAVARVGTTLVASLKVLAAQLAMLPVAESVLVINDVNEKTIATNVTSAAASSAFGAPAQAQQPVEARQTADTAEAVEANW